LLRFFDNTGQAHPMTDIENFCLLHKADGSIRLAFDIEASHPLYSLVAEECRIEYGDNKYLVKKIKNGGIDCDLDFDFLKTKIYENFSSGSVLLSELLYAHLPQGWSVINGNITNIRRTITADFCTDYDIIMESMNTYGVYLEWYIKKKQVKVYLQSVAEVTGEYLTDELNLRDISLQGDSLDLITRLYARGKDGLTFADINDGKPYVDNTDYVNKVVCGIWQDDRYTDAESLLAATKEKLKTLAFPVRAYECDVVDFAKIDPKYSFLDFKLHKAVMLLDSQHKINVQHRIVQYKEYPYEPKRNVITLSCVPATITTSIRSVSTSLKGEISQESKRLNEAILKATQAITGNSGGYVVFRPATNPQEILIMDTPDVETAQNVWRWNLAGLGFSSTGVGDIGDTARYVTALTYDGSFVADFIKVGILDGTLLKAGSVSASAISQEYTTQILDEVNGTISEISALFEATSEGLKSEITNIINTMNANKEEISKQINTLKNDITGLSYSVQRAYRGGINKVVNSSGMNGVSDDWNAVGPVLAIEDSTTSSGCCFMLGEDSAISQTISNLIPNKAYTISFKIKKTYANYTGSFKVLYGDTVVNVFSQQAAQSSWQECHIVIPAISETSLTIQIESSKAYMYVADIIVVEGDFENSIGWQPAPDEVYTTEVKIDKNGIRVIKSDSSVSTNITNDAFRVQRRNNKGTYDDSVLISEKESMMNDMTLKGTTRIQGVSTTMVKPCDSGFDITVLD